MEGYKAHYNLMIVTSFTLLSEEIRNILESEKDIQVIAETSGHLEIIPLVEQKKPDILFIDTSLPNLDTLKILESIREKSAETRVLLLLYTQNEDFIINAISLGAWGYLKPTANKEQLIRAIRAIIKGEIWAERKIITKVLTRVLSPGKVKLALKPKVTKKEEEIMKLIVQGYRNRQVAKKLFISESTVKTHLVHIYEKLDVKNRHQLTIKLGHYLLGPGVVIEREDSWGTANEPSLIKTIKIPTDF